MKRVNTFLTSLFAVTNVCRGSERVQICHSEPALHSNACVAVRTVKSQYERGHDLLMTFSIEFYDRSGWVAFGIGDAMDRALMFVLWPGEHEGDIVLSLRSTTDHHPPLPLKNQRQVHVHSTEVDRDGFHVLQATCYACETIGLGPLNATSEQQSWIFASSYIQQTKTNDANLRLDMHTDYGYKSANMAQAIYTNQIEEYPIVAAGRSSMHAVDSIGSYRLAGSTSVNMWNVHGLVSSFSVILNCLGFVLIHSDLKWAFRSHWIVQTLAALGLLIGGLIGVLKSTNAFQVESFTSMHKLIGLSITMGVPVQITFGYKHHINYIKYGKRTTSCFVHIYLGRALFVALNGNVLLGLLHARERSILQWVWVAIVLCEIFAVGFMIFAKRTKKENGYKCVDSEELDPFAIGDEEEKLRDSKSLD